MPIRSARRPGSRARSWPRTRAPRARTRARRTASRRPASRSRRRSCVTTRSALATIQRRAASSTSARPANPIASQTGCASRARATIARTSSGPRSGTVAIVSPVAGFSTGIPAPVEPRSPHPRTSEIELSPPARAGSRSCRLAGARIARMRTVVVSDLHLGSSGSIDLLRRPELREALLWPSSQGADGSSSWATRSSSATGPCPRRSSSRGPSSPSSRRRSATRGFCSCPAITTTTCSRSGSSAGAWTSAAPLGLEQRIPARSGPAVRALRGTRPEARRARLSRGVAAERTSTRLTATTSTAT